VFLVYIAISLVVDCKSCKLIMSSMCDFWVLICILLCLCNCYGLVTSFKVAQSVNFFTNSLSSSQPERATVSVNGRQISMEIDTGSGVTIVSESFCRKVLKLKLNPSPLQLKTITSPIEIIGESLVVVQVAGLAPQTLKLYVVNCLVEFLPLMGRDWLDVLIPKWRDNFNVLSGSFTLSNSVDQVLPVLLNLTQVCFLRILHHVLKILKLT